MIRVEAVFHVHVHVHHLRSMSAADWVKTYDRALALVQAHNRRMRALHRMITFRSTSCGVELTGESLPDIMPLAEKIERLLT